MTIKSIKADHKYSLSFYIFYIAIILIYFNFLRSTFDQRGESFGPLIRMIFISIGPALLFLSTISALMEGQLRRINNNYQIWIVSLIFIFIGLIFNGLIVQNSPRLITLDIIHYMFFLPGILIGVKKENWAPLDRLIRIIFLINVISPKFPT